MSVNVQGEFSVVGGGVCSLLQRPLLGGELKGQVLYLALTSVCCEYALEYETQ